MRDTETVKPETVRDIPEHWVLVNDSQDVEDTLRMIGISEAQLSFHVYGALFVEVGNSEYLNVYSIVGTVPFLGKPVFDMMEKAIQGVTTS